MKYFTIIFSAFIIVGSLFCSTDLNKEPKELVRKDLTKYNLVFKDTMEFQTDGDVIWILDKNTSFYLGMNSAKNKIYLFNLKGKLITKIEKEGKGPEEYHKIKQIALTPNGNIIVVNTSKAILYNREGTFLTECAGLYEDFLPIGPPRSIAIDDSTIVFSSVHPHNIKKNVSYFRNKENFTSTALNVFTCEFENFAPYEDESIYTKKFLPLMFSKLYAINPKNNSIVTTYPYDNNIYTYDKSNRTKYKNIKMYPDYFGLVEGAKGGDKGLDKQTYLVQKNSNNRSIEVSEDGKVLIQYTKGRSDDQIFKSLAGSNSVDYKPKRYFGVYDLLSGQKITEDILDDSENMRLVDFIDMENIIFYTNKLNNNDLEDKVHVIRASLE